LRDPDALAEALKAFFTRHKLPRKGVRLGIASNRIGVRIFDIIGVEEEKQLANAVQFRAQEALPIPLDEAVLDYRVLSESVDESGGSALNVALARVLDSTPSEVEGVKRSLSLDGSTEPEGLTAEQTAASLDAVRRQVQTFARELVSSLQFYQNQPGSLGIGEVVLTGGTAHLPGLAEELERLIGVHVVVGDPLARLKIPKRFAQLEQVGSLAVAIGLGIED